MKIKAILTSLALVASLAFTAPVAQAKEGTLYVPIPSYRVGPYAVGGTGYFGGILDYYNLLNMRDGGLNGMKLIWSECETEYSVERGVECYKRLKDKEGGAVFFDPLSVGISTALIETGRKDKMPIIAVNHGKTAGQRGDVFPYYFMPGINTYDEHSIMMHFIGDVLEGDRSKLKGKKIAMLFHGSPYGREAIKLIEAITFDPEVGMEFDGKVTRLMTFGAFVEFAPGREGLVHISELEWHRVEKVEDVCSPGDEMKIKLIKIDDQGRLDFSRKALLEKPEGWKPPPRRDRGNNNRGGGRKPFKGRR